MRCDDCYKNDAVSHLGHGICLCDICLRNFNRRCVIEKMQHRSETLRKLAEGDFVDFEDLKQIPIDMWIDSDSRIRD